ncbi:MAG: hypothetical protein JXC32_18360 [Anaerolineae bacterium]|nr:hypothetical protein [Anaerolineae bacterium]
MIQLMTKLLSSWLVRIAIVICMVPAAAFLYLKLSGQLNPGPLSMAHQECEKDCKLCHVPVHCLTPNRCQECHQEVAQQMAQANGLHAHLPGTDRCQTCHIEHDGKDATITKVALTHLDHAALTGFSLDLHLKTAAGEAMVCEDCHSDGTYVAEAVDCAGCHMEENGDSALAHAERYGGDCLLCHDGEDRMLVFDHQETYALEGAHADAACEDCHQDRVFAGLAQDCVACHEEPAYHAGQFGTDCARCHGLLAWAPAELTHHTFELAHGVEEAPACTTCHIESYAAYTCEACHAPLLVEDQHGSAGTTDLTLCAECHPTGSEDEIAELRANRTTGGIPAHATTAQQVGP